MGGGSFLLLLLEYDGRWYINTLISTCTETLPLKHHLAEFVHCSDSNHASPEEVEEEVDEEEQPGTPPTVPKTPKPTPATPNRHRLYKHKVWETCH